MSRPNAWKRPSVSSDDKLPQGGSFATALFADYLAEYQGLQEAQQKDSDDSHTLARLKQHLSGQHSRMAVCLICLEDIEADAAVWECRQSCYCMVHLLCIQAWGRQQIQSSTARASQSEANGHTGQTQTAQAVTWACPKPLSPMPTRSESILFLWQGECAAPVQPGSLELWQAVRQAPGLWAPLPPALPCRGLPSMQPLQSADVRVRRRNKDIALQ
ncbi:hypothetical protein WJX73_009179 [Symbiochloris irregularis]|uniref:RING-type domain-containing protein n=1 Tax=Symbiochloris irregularis TaxID=706552 RepID=A0AAW1PWQ1_9CHLO